MIRLLIAALFVLYLLRVSPLRGADALPPGLAEIAAAKRFVIGWRPEGRPMSWLPPGNAEPDGFSVALCRRIADAFAVSRTCTAGYLVSSTTPPQARCSSQGLTPKAT
jgi:ABC-type amino acid transport substrate-binding protein